MSENSNHFKLHIEPGHHDGHFDVKHSHLHQNAKPVTKSSEAFKINFDTQEMPQKTANLVHKPKKAKGIKGIFVDAWRQFVASAVILIIGFFLLNSSAYYQIFASRIKNFLGIGDSAILNDIAVTNSENSQSGRQKTLEASNDPEEQKRQIPGLNLEVSPIDERIIIPRIGQNIPLVRVSSGNLIKRDWAALEGDIQEALRGGVVHYPGTSLPGQKGNVVITGHSSYFPWDPGRFKDVFALLHDLQLGDRIVIYYRQNKYIYEVKDIKIVLPEEIEVLRQTPDNRLTLITCTPIGTNLKRLIVVADPIDTEPVEEKTAR